MLKGIHMRALLISFIFANISHCHTKTNPKLQDFVSKPDTTFIQKNETDLYDYNNFTIKENHVVNYENPNNVKDPKIIIQATNNASIFGYINTKASIFILAKHITIGEKAVIKAKNADFVSNNILVQGRVIAEKTCYHQYLNKRDTKVFISNKLVKIKQSLEDGALLKWFESLKGTENEVSMLRFEGARIDANIYVSGFDLACFDNTNITKNKFIKNIGLLELKNNHHGFHLNSKQWNINNFVAYDALKEDVFMPTTSKTKGFVEVREREETDSSVFSFNIAKFIRKTLEYFIQR